MRMTLPKLQNDDKKAKKLSLEGLLKGWKDIKEMLYYQGLCTIGQCYDKILKPTSRVVTFAWHQKWFGRSPTVIFSHCLYQHIGGKTCQ